MIPPHDGGHKPTFTLALALASPCYILRYKKERLSACVRCEDDRQGTSAPRRPLRFNFSSATPSPLRLPLRDEYQTSGTALSTSTPGPRERLGSIDRLIHKRIGRTIGYCGHYTRLILLFLPFLSICPELNRLWPAIGIDRRNFRPIDVPIAYSIGFCPRYKATERHAHRSLWKARE